MYYTCIFAILVHGLFQGREKWPGLCCQSLNVRTYVFHGEFLYGCPVSGVSELSQQFSLTLFLSVILTLCKCGHTTGTAITGWLLHAHYSTCTYMRTFRKYMCVLSTYQDFEIPGSTGQTAGGSEFSGDVLHSHTRQHH